LTRLGDGFKRAVQSLIVISLEESVDKYSHPCNIACFFSFHLLNNVQKNCTFLKGGHSLAVQPKSMIPNVFLMRMEETEGKTMIVGPEQSTYWSQNDRVHAHTFIVQIFVCHYT